MKRTVLATGLQFPEWPVWLGPRRAAFTCSAARPKGEEPAKGGVGRVGPSPLDARVELAAPTPAFPNGIPSGPDNRLYVAQSVTQKILVMDAQPGATPAVWATLPRGYPDGFCFDAAGWLYAAGSLGDVVVVFEPDGEVRDIIEMGAGSERTNCCLGDDP